MSAPNAHGHDAGRFGPGTVIRRAIGGIAEVNAPDLFGDGFGRFSSDEPAELRDVDSFLTPQLLDELVERVADRIEERVIIELERRGRRSLPEVF